MPHRVRLDSGSRLAPHRGDRGVRRDGRGGQADGPERGADAARVRHRLQPRGGQPAMHPGRRTDQAHASGSGGERGRVLGRAGQNRLHRGTQHLQRQIRVSGALPAERPRCLAASERPGHRLSRGGTQLQTLPLRPPVTQRHRRGIGGSGETGNRARRRHRIRDDRGRLRRSGPRHPPSHPGGGGPVRPPLPGRHRLGPRQGRHRRGR